MQCILFSCSCTRTAEAKAPQPQQGSIKSSLNNDYPGNICCRHRKRFLELPDFYCIIDPLRKNCLSSGALLHLQPPVLHPDFINQVGPSPQHIELSIPGVAATPEDRSRGNFKQSVDSFTPVKDMPNSTPLKLGLSCTACQKRYARCPCESRF